jgi:hypothetical protein
VSGKIFFNHPETAIFKIFANISPLQGLFLEFVMFSTNIYAALPLKKAAEQQNICNQTITWIPKSCRAAKY